jgi:CHASE1-domain containing sensor protein
LPARSCRSRPGRASRLREERLAELEFNARSEDYRAVLQTGIDNYIDKIQALQALFGAMPNVSRQQFLDYANALLGGHPAILAVAWVPRVAHAERAQHERTGVREGYVNYQIRSQQPDGSLVAAPSASE